MKVDHVQHEMLATVSKRRMWLRVLGWLDRMDMTVILEKKVLVRL